MSKIKVQYNHKDNQPHRLIPHKQQIGNMVQAVVNHKTSGALHYEEHLDLVARKLSVEGRWILI